MIPPQVLLILVVLTGGYYVGDAAVKGIKHVDTKIVHVVRHIVHK